MMQYPPLSRASDRSSLLVSIVFFFFFNDTATTEIYTLSLHDALPICQLRHDVGQREPVDEHDRHGGGVHRSEEHTSELQSRPHLVCRLLLEKKKKTTLRAHRHAVLRRMTDTHNVADLTVQIQRRATRE